MSGGTFTLETGLGMLGLGNIDRRINNLESDQLQT